MGVLYNRRTDTLSFFENGRSMGAAYEGILAPLQGMYGHLYPFIILEKSEEQVTLLPAPRAAGFPARAHELEAEGDLWAPAPHPDDGTLIIGSRWGTFRCR